MSMGIEHFRQIVEQKSDLANRRITVGHHGISAPNQFKGRIVDWFRGTETNERRQQENVRARSTFYQALKKAYGEEIAKQAVQEGVHVDSETFTTKVKTFQGSHIEKILKIADRLKTENTRNNESALKQFVSGGALTTAAVALKDLLGYDDFDVSDPELRSTFVDLVRNDPRFHRGNLTVEELGDLASRAVRQCFDAKKARFEEEYPQLAKLDTEHFHDAKTWFDNERRQIGTTLDSLGFDDDTKDWFNGAFNGIKDTSGYLGDMAFDHDNLEDVEDQLRDHLDFLNETIAQAPDFIGGGGAKTVLDEVWNEQPIGTNEDEQKLVREALDNALKDFVETVERDGGTLTDGDTRAALTEHLCEALKAALEKAWPDTEPDQRDLSVLAFREAFGPRLEENDGWVAVQQRRDTAGDQLEALSKTRYVLKQELQRQIDKGTAKLNAVRELRDHQPLSEKRTAFMNWVLWEATKLFVDEQSKGLKELRKGYVKLNDYEKVAEIDQDLELLKNLVGPDRIKDLSAYANDARHRWKEADPNNPRTPNVVRGEIRQDRNEVLRFLKPYWDGAYFRPKGGRGKMLDDYATKALGQMHQWKPIERDMVVTRDGVTRTYRSEIIPGSKLGGAVGERYTDGQEGVDDEDRVEPNHAPNLQVSRLIHVDPDNPDTGTVKSEVIQHSMLDTWDIEDERERARVSKEEVREILTTSAQLSSEEFKTEALRLNQDHARCEIIHVAIAMRTEDLSGQHLDRKEGDFIEHQLDSFSSFDRREIRLKVLAKPLPKTQERDLVEEFDEVEDREILIEESSNNSEPLDDRDQLLRGKDWDEVRLDLPDDVDIPFEEEATLNWLRANPDWFETEYGKVAPNQPDPNSEVEMKLEDEPDDDQPRIQNVSFNVETITFSFGISGVRAQSSRFDEHDRRNMIRLVGDLTAGTTPGGHIGRVVDRLQRKVDAEDTPENEKRELNTLITEIRRQTDIVREEFTSGRYKNTKDDPYRMPRHVTQLVNLSSQALAALGHHQMHMSVSQSTRNFLEGGGISDVEHKAQVIMDDMGARTRPGQRLSEQDRTIYNTVLTGSGQDEMNLGLTGGGGIRNRSGNRGVLQQTEGLILMKV